MNMLSIPDDELINAMGREEALKHLMQVGSAVYQVFAAGADLTEGRELGYDEETLAEDEIRYIGGEHLAGVPPSSLPESLREMFLFGEHEDELEVLKKMLDLEDDNLNEQLGRVSTRFRELLDKNFDYEGAEALKRHMGISYVSIQKDKKQTKELNPVCMARLNSLMSTALRKRNGDFLNKLIPMLESGILMQNPKAIEVSNKRISSEKRFGVKGTGGDGYELCATYGFANNSEPEAANVPILLKLIEGADVGWTYFEETKDTPECKFYVYDSVKMIHDGFKFVALPLGKFVARPPQYFCNFIHQGYISNAEDTSQLQNLNAIRHFIRTPPVQCNSVNPMVKGLFEFFAKYRNCSADEHRRKPRELIFNYAEAICRLSIVRLFPNVGSNTSILCDRVFSSEVPDFIRKELGIVKDTVMDNIIIKVCLASLCIQTYKLSPNDREDKVLTELVTVIDDFVLRCLGVPSYKIVRSLTPVLQPLNISDHGTLTTDKDNATHSQGDKLFCVSQNLMSFYRALFNLVHGHKVEEYIPVDAVVPLSFDYCGTVDESILGGTTTDSFLYVANGHARIKKACGEPFVLCIQRILESWNVTNTRMLVLPSFDSHHTLIFPDLPLRRCDIPVVTGALANTLATWLVKNTAQKVWAGFPGSCEKNQFGIMREVFKESSKFLPYSDLLYTFCEAHRTVWSRVFLILPGGRQTEVPTAEGLIALASKRTYLNTPIERVWSPQGLPS